MSRPSSVPLSAVCDRITDGTHQPPKFSNDGVPFIFVSNIGDGRINLKTSKFITPGQHQDLTRRCPIEPGDVLYTTVGSYGNAAQVLSSAPFAFQRHIAHLKPKRDLVAPAYLAAVLNSAIVKGQVDRLVRGVAQKTLNLAALKSVIVPLPALREQQRIVDILDRADALRAKRRASLALLDTLTQSTFVNMFGGGEGRWPSATIGEVASPENGSIRTGPFGSQLLHGEFTQSGVAVLGIDNAVDNQFRWAARRFIPDQKYASLKRYTVNPGDVIITIMGTCGRCAIVPDGVPRAINTKHLCCITLDRSKCLPEFLHAYFLRHPAARRYLEQKAKGAIMAGLNMGIIKAMPIPLVPIEAQEEFARRVAGVDKLKAAHLASLTQLDALFASLQHRAFRGEL